MDEWGRSKDISRNALTFMFRFGDKLSDHGLNHANVAVQQATDGSAKQCNPDV